MGRPAIIPAVAPVALPVPTGPQAPGTLRRDAEMALRATPVAPVQTPVIVVAATLATRLATLVAPIRLLPAVRRTPTPVLNKTVVTDLGAVRRVGDRRLGLRQPVEMTIPVVGNAPSETLGRGRPEEVRVRLPMATVDAVGLVVGLPRARPRPAPPWAAKGVPRPVP